MAIARKPVLAEKMGHDYRRLENRLVSQKPADFLLVSIFVPFGQSFQ